MRDFVARLMDKDMARMSDPDVQAEPDEAAMLVIQQQQQCFSFDASEAKLMFPQRCVR